MKAKRLSVLDSSWLLVERPETPMHVGMLAIFTPPADAPDSYLRDLVAAMREAGPIQPPFNRRLVRGRMAKLMPAWETLADARIDLDYHLRHSALPRPGGERELGVLVSRLHSHPLDHARPLWECHVIEGLEGGRFAMYAKIHHAMMDGVAGARLLQATMSPDPQRRAMLPFWAVPRAPKARPDAEARDWRSVMLDAALAQARSLPGLARSFRTLASAARARERAMAVPYDAPRCRLNGPISPQRRLATQSFDFERFHALAEASGGTINDVTLAICGAALRRYLAEVGEVPDKPVIASLPVSVRPADGGDEGNAITFMIGSLATHLADPVERLAAVTASTRRAKEHLQALPRAAINQYSVLAMAPYMLAQIAGVGARVRPMFNTVVSNVPGPKQPLFLNGARMEALYPASLIFDGQALNITVFSYAGRFNFSFTACRDSLPHVQRLAVYAGEALEELERAYARPSPKPRARKRRARASG